jgi:nucleoside-diphosphate-sugar epimerase
MVIAFLMEKTLKPLGIQPPLHRRRLDFFRKSFYFSRTKPSQVLGFEPQTSFSEGVRKTAKWYKENGYL